MTVKVIRVGGHGSRRRRRRRKRRKRRVAKAEESKRCEKKRRGENGVVQRGSEGESKRDRESKREDIYIYVRAARLWKKS